MVKVVTIGEILIRFQAPNHSRLSQTPHFDTYYGGAEANVAVGLSHLGHELTLLSSLPKNHSLGDRAVQHLLKHSVSDRLILRDGERIGIYYVEQGFSNRPGKVVYDRHELTAYHFDGHSLHEGKTVSFEVLDRIGGGDSFAAGVLHGIFSDMKPSELLEFTTALSVLNHFVLGDNSGFSEEEVFDYIHNQSGDVSR